MTLPMSDTPTTPKVVSELVYDDGAVKWIVERWPQAVVTDASDFVHEERSEVTISGLTKDEFYPVIIREGWSDVCLQFQMHLMADEDRTAVRRWIARAKELKVQESDDN